MPTRILKAVWLKIRGASCLAKDSLDQTHLNTKTNLTAYVKAFTSSKNSPTPKTQGILHHRGIKHPHAALNLGTTTHLMI